MQGSGDTIALSLNTANFFKNTYIRKVHRHELVKDVKYTYTSELKKKSGDEIV